MLLADFIREGTRSLGSLYPEREARSIVLMLCEALLGTKSYTHVVEPEKAVEPGAVAALEAAMARLRGGEPVQYVLGYAEFCGFRFRVTPDVLIPRQETEQLVEDAVEAARLRRKRGPGAPPVRVLDLCTGSGCIAWSVALLAPWTEVVAVDVSEAALAVARAQDLAHEADVRGGAAPIFVRADVLDTEQDFDFGTFDIILSNPPYLTESERSLMHRNVLEHEPDLALFVPGDDPLVFYRAIARWSERVLQPDGCGIVEINDRLAGETEEVFRSAGFAETRAVKDVFERNRFVFFSKKTH